MARVRIKTADQPRNGRNVLSAGDGAGAADLGRRVAGNLKERRRQLGLSLDQLAQTSGVSRAALSQIETCKTNPSLSVLWKVATGLGIPFAELLDAGSDGVSLLRRSEAQTLRSPDGKFESRPLARSGAGPGVEAYELTLAARSRYASEAHATGTRELVTVISGSLRITVGQESYLLSTGDSLVFAADQAHVYENPGSAEGRYQDVIVYKR